jgi:5-hydroxyisourate hydrolase-like protein (transthyretin family)
VTVTAGDIAVHVLAATHGEPATGAAEGVDADLQEPLAGTLVVAMRSR